MKTTLGQCVSWTGGIFILSIFVFNCCRAYRQSITIDEAYTYLSFVAPPVAQILSTYAANHHVLHSLLCKFTVSAFGLSEFTLRIPSIAGGAAALVALWLTARLLFGPGFKAIACLALVGLNPLVLDFESAARGYSLALAGFLWGVYVQLRGFTADKAKSTECLIAGGALFGLAASANLAFVFPCLAALCVFPLALVTLRVAGIRASVKCLMIPLASFAAIVLLICGGPLLHATGTDFVAGASSIREMWSGITKYAFYHEAPTVDVTAFARGLSGVLSGFSDLAAIVIAVCGCGLVGAIAWARRPGEPVLLREAALLVVGGTLLGALGILVCAHYILGLPYPEDRMAIYIIPLAVMLAAIELEWLDRRMALLTAIATTYTVLMLVRFSSEITMNSYHLWWFDAGAKRISEKLRALPSNTKISASWSLLPSLEFYRSAHFWKALAPVAGQYLATNTSGDYVVIDAYSRDVIERDHLSPLFRDGVSGAILAVHECSTDEPLELAGVVNSASGEGRWGSGSLVSLHGTGFSRRGSPAWAASANRDFPTTLDCVAVEFSGHRAPILYADDHQVNVQVPDLAGVDKTEVRLILNPARASRIVSNGLLHVVETISPAVFRASDGDAIAAAVESEGVGLPAARRLNRPVHPGETIALFGTGFGMTWPPQPVGARAEGRSSVTAPLHLRFDGRILSPHEILYRGHVIGSISGYYQLAFKVPDDARPGRVSLEVDIGGARSSVTYLRIE